MFSLISAQMVLVYLFLLGLYLTPSSDALKNELIITSDCACPSYRVTYECTVQGTENGFTVWRGSAFNCVSNEITLRHRLFMSEQGALGECNGGSILGRSLRITGGSFYTSQLSVRVSPEVAGKTVECVLDDIIFTSIGNATVNVSTGPFPPPGEVNINLTALSTRALTFSWNPIAANCPAIHYNILASNCGSCPTTTNHTNVTCTDIPITYNAILCTFALRTVVCGHTAGIVSNPISVPLSDSSSVRESFIYNGGNDKGSEVLISGLIGALISAIVLFAVCVVPFMIALTVQIRIKKRLQIQLANSKTTVKFNIASKSDSKADSADTVTVTKVDTRRNVSYESNPAAVSAKKNIAYEHSSTVVDTRKNVAYETT